MRIQDKNSKPVTIHACVETGDLIGLQRLLRQNPFLLNERTILTVQTPLHISSGQNRVEIVKYLLEWIGPQELELEAQNVYGETPLHVAVKNGCNEVVRMLLDYGAYVEARTNNLMTPLHLAVGFALRTGDDTSVKTLLEFNADCSAEDDEGMMPYNYLPEGQENEELHGLLYIEEQSDDNTTDHSSTEYRSDEELRKSDDGIKGKMDEFEYELSKIVGLHELKQQLRKWAKGMLLDEIRREMGSNLGPRKPPHMAFLGNPGTGKTTVARVLGKLLHSVGVLSSDTVKEVQRTDLVGEYIGQTGPKTRNKIEEAMGGILFVDEAYRLAIEQKTGFPDFGVEALEEIMSVLEDGDLVVIFAGYTQPMKRVFSSNEGFCRRVTHFFQFDDFSCKELAEMLMVKMSRQDERSRLCGFKLHPSCTFDAVVALIERNSTGKLRNKMNGGLVDHMLNNARENLDSRLSFDSKGDELLTITLQDLEAGLQLLSERVKVD
ncbi:UNVERIFIED_CONTAM: protein CbbX [Sesamum angustifolium]|uniref:Protein CbbX n=1 Tax=Sesamum angustifolium TaxID=2727405 RepID=A0AAW2MT31_9LAMI